MNPTDKIPADAGLIIRLARPSDCRGVAMLHKKYINTGFLSSIGVEFLTLVYAEVASSKDGVLVVAVAGDEVVGFHAGVKDTKAFYKRFCIRNALKSAYYIMPRIFSKKTVYKLFETAMYPFRKKSPALGFPEGAAESLSTVADPRFQGTGLSYRLFDALKVEMVARGMKDIVVIVGGDNIRSQKFYQKCGFKHVGDFEMHKGLASGLYCMDLRDQGKGKNGS